MKTEEILWSDYRKVENQVIIKKALCKIGPLKKYAEEDDDFKIPQEKIEKVIGIMVRKYNIMPQWITPTYIEGERNMYSCSIKTSDTHQWLGNVTATYMYELLAKMAIKIYSDIKHEKISKKESKE